MTETESFHQPTLEFNLSPEAYSQELFGVQAELDKLHGQIDLAERPDLEAFRGIFAEVTYCARAKRYQELEANTNRLVTGDQAFNATIEQQRLLEVFRRNGSLPLDARLDFLLDHPEMRGIELGHADITLGGSEADLDTRMQLLFLQLMNSANIHLNHGQEGRKVAYDPQDYYLAGNGAVVTRVVGRHGSRDLRAEAQLPPGERAAMGPFRQVTITRDMAYMNVDDSRQPDDQPDLTFRRRSVVLLDLRYEGPRRFYDHLLIGSSSLPSQALQSDIFRQKRQEYDDVTEQLVNSHNRLVIPISTISYVSWTAERASYAHAQPTLFDIGRRGVDPDTGDVIREPAIIMPDDRGKVVSR